MLGFGQDVDRDWVVVILFGRGGERRHGRHRDGGQDGSVRSLRQRGFDQGGEFMLFIRNLKVNEKSDGRLGKEYMNIDISLVHVYVAVHACTCSCAGT